MNLEELVKKLDSNKEESNFDRFLLDFAPHKNKKPKEEYNNLTRLLMDPNSKQDKFYNSSFENPLELESKLFNENNNIIINKIYEIKKYEENDLFSKKSSLENYIINQTYKNQNISKIIKSDIIKSKEIFTDNNLESYIFELNSIGFKETKKKPEREIVIPPFKEVSPQGISVQAPQLVPESYVPILHMLRQEFPGARYKETRSLVNESQHNVDIVSFEYQHEGKTKQVHVVLKDANDKELAIPEWLRQHGVKTNGIYMLNGKRMVMQHVGNDDLRTALSNASESELMNACNAAIDNIARMHVVGSVYSNELEHDFGVTLKKVNYISEFKRRFIEPVSGNSIIMSPQAMRLIQAYSSFAKRFNPGYFTHGDLHDKNIRDDSSIIDFETATIGMTFDDLSRITNSILRTRPDIETEDFERAILNRYITSHNEAAEEEKQPIMFPAQQMFNLALINDEIYKIGEYVTFGALRPEVREEKMEKSVKCFENTLSMIDREILKGQDLYELRMALTDYAKTSPYEELRRVAFDKYLLAA